jgi:hypothetical protein
MKPIKLFLLASLTILSSCIIKPVNEQKLPYSEIERDYSFIQEYSLKSPAAINISTAGGNISMTGTEGEKCEVAFVVNRRGRTYDMTLENLKEIAEVEIINTDSELSINIKKIYQRNVSVGFIIKAPFETSSDLNTSGGNINIEDLNGSQKINTSGGNLRFRNLTGSVTASTSGGNINVEHCEGDFNIRTSGGNIKLNDIKGPVKTSTSGGNIEAVSVEPELIASTSGGNIYCMDIKGKTDVKTSGGHITLGQLSGSAYAYTSGGSIDASVISLTGELNLETSGGSIDINLPSGLGLNLDLSGDHISTKLNNFSGTAKKEKVIGTLNGGGLSVRARTSGGSINLSYE